MTAADIEAIRVRCRRAWYAIDPTARPRVLFDEYFHDAVVHLLSEAKRRKAENEPEPANFEIYVWNECRTVLRKNVRFEIKEREAHALAAFEAQRHVTGDVLPSTFEVPSKRWGGARKGAGRPKKQAA